ncbi:interferon-induced protein 44-like [Hoplias malabaricus]|uniref:interferon-induced protein 44-like n=1 Tax=Hoplias malabaricus TaxID=27720 RepID=UPI003462F0DC
MPRCKKSIFHALDKNGRCLKCEKKAQIDHLPPTPAQSRAPAPGPTTPTGPKPPGFDNPWREVIWSESSKKQILSQMKQFQLRTSEVDCLKILLHGPVGAGKSSFISSINTALQGHVSTIALANAPTGVSFTKKFKIHTLNKDGPRFIYPFAFSDVMGLEEGQSAGVHTEDIFNILEGHMKNGYQFNPVHPISKGSEHYRSDPELNHKVHCLVSVLPADKISLIPDAVIQKMRTVREKARNLDIPQVVIIPKVDLTCPLVDKDIRNIYISRKIKEKMEECSNRLGVPMNCIFPLKNYSEEINNNLYLDILILMALKSIVMFANDYVEDQVYADDDE